MRAMDNAGAVVGVLICIAFVNVLGFRLLFALAAIPGLAASLLIIFNIREKSDGGARLYKGPAFKDVDRNLTLTIISNAIFALGAFTYSFLMIYAGKFGFKTATLPLLYLIYTFTASILSIPFGRLADKIGRKPVMFIAFGFWAAVCAVVILGGSSLAIVSVFILFGIHKAALDPVQKTLVCELSPVQFRASCLGGFQMIIGLCALPASLLAGFLWEFLGMLIPFYASIVLTAIASIILIFVKEKREVGSSGLS
jgi:MFS family permease